MPDVTWTIRTKSNGDITADGLLEGPPSSYGRAEEVSLPFRFANSNEAAYESLRDYLDYAGASATGETVTHVPWYREQLPGRASVDSEVVAIIPSTDIDLPGLWGLIVGGEDQTNAPMTNHVIVLDLFVLAEFSEYADHAAVEQDLSA